MTTISRMDHTTGAAKIRKQTVWNDWCGQLSTQKNEMEISKNHDNSVIKICQGGHTGIEENNCCWKNWGHHSHPGICHSLHMKVIAGRKLPTARQGKLIMSEIMTWNFVFSDSCENCITSEKVLAKCWGKSPFLEYLGFQAWKDALEFSMCQMCEQNMLNKMMEEKAGAERQNSKKGFEKNGYSSIVESLREFLWFQIPLPVCI